MCQKYKISGEIVGPLKKSSQIITIWIILKDNKNPQFVTAYPGDKK